MTVFSNADLLKNAEAILDEAKTHGEVRIRRGTDEEYVLRAVRTYKPAPGKSALDVGTVKLGASMEDILQAIDDGRHRWDDKV